MNAPLFLYDKASGFHRLNMGLAWSYYKLYNSIYAIATIYSGCPSYYSIIESLIEQE